MPNSSYSTIIFDLGGVVLTNDHPYHMPSQIQEFQNYFKTDFESLSNGFDEVWPDFRIGKITENEFWKKFLVSSRAKAMDIDYAKKFYRKHQAQIEKMLSLLSILKNKYRLAALSTISKEWLDFKKDRFNLDKYFKVIVGSGYVGIAKPDLGIYKYLMSKLEVSPSSCVFIDDMDINLPPAQKLGIKTILFESQDKLEKELQKLGLLNGF